MKCFLGVLLLVLSLHASRMSAQTIDTAAFDAAAAERLANLALACIHQDYPNKLIHILNIKADLALARINTPWYYEFHDWHSPVNGHRGVAPLIRTVPN